MAEEEKIRVGDGEAVELTEEDDNEDDEEMGDDDDDDDERVVNQNAFGLLTPERS
jgi:hypothetical protein